MSHDQWKDRTAALVDGGLPPDEAAQAHIASCADCAALMRDLEQTRLALGSLRELEPSDRDLEALRRNVLAGVSAPQPRRIRFLWAPAAAALAAIAAVWFRPPPEPGPPPLVQFPVRPPSVAVARKVDRPSRPKPARRAQPAIVIQSVREMTDADTGAVAQLVRIRTEDPRVALYWVLDRQGDQAR